MSIGAGTVLPVNAVIWGSVRHDHHHHRHRAGAAPDRDRAVHRHRRLHRSGGPAGLRGGSCAAAGLLLGGRRGGPGVRGHRREVRRRRGDGGVRRRRGRLRAGGGRLSRARGPVGPGGVEGASPGRQAPCPDPGRPRDRRGDRGSADDLRRGLRDDQRQCGGDGGPVAGLRAARHGGGLLGDPGGHRRADRVSGDATGVRAGQVVPP